MVGRFSFQIGSDFYIFVFALSLHLHIASFSMLLLYLVLCVMNINMSRLGDDMQKSSRQDSTDLVRASEKVIMGDDNVASSLSSSKGESLTVYVEQVPDLQVFAAKSKPGDGEVDYRHWRRAAVRLIEDTAVSTARKKKSILDSLQGKAADIVDFHRNDSLKLVLELLDSNYKQLVDGDDLLADFYQMFQPEKVKASDYLSDLYVELIEVVKEGGTTLNQMPRLLLTQFLRGCSDDDLLLKLRLDDCRSKPPSFPSLMSDVRREECKRTERRLRLRRGVPTQSPVATVELGSAEVAALQQRVEELEAIVAAQKLAGSKLTDASAQNSTNEKKMEPLQQRVTFLERNIEQVEAVPIFCYHCGLDNHKAFSCRKPSNKALVLEKRRQYFDKSDIENRNMESVGVRSQGHSLNSSTSIPTNLIGTSPEIVVKVNDVDCKSLVDTGSQITTMSHSFFLGQFPDTVLISLHSLLRIASVGGDILPYHGYFHAVIDIPVSDRHTLSETIPIVVVPDTDYNQKVPLLLGTNVLNNLLFISATPKVAALKVAKQTLELEARHLEKNKGVLSQVFAVNDISIPAKSALITSGKTTVTIPIRQQMALIQQCTDSIAVIPTVIDVKQGYMDVPVEMVNSSDQDIYIRKGKKIAEIHQVTIESTTGEVDSDFLNSFDYNNVSPSEKIELQNFLMKNRDLFAMSMNEMGRTNLVTHTIDLIDDTPVKEKARPIPPGMYDELKAHLTELLNAGVVRESNSPFASNMVYVRKKDGSLRLAQDFRPLNLRTRTCAYNLANIDTLIDSLRGSKYFASLDLFAGYHQVEIEEAHKERTAFHAGPFGLLEYNMMSFGLSGAPSSFQKLMDTCLDGLNMKICAVYLDDVIVYAESKEQLYERLEQVFARLRSANLRLKSKKCKFLQTSVDFLGRTVSEKGVECKKDHLSAVADWPEPSDVKELQSFLGFTNYFRKYIAGYASIAEPLLELMRGLYKPSQKGKSGKGKRQRGRIKPDITKWEWGERQKKAFCEIKDALVSPPVLDYPDFNKDFVLHVDASRTGLGGVLYQKGDDGKLRVLAYGSKSLGATERNYSAHKLEFLALKWAVTQKFQHYLYGKPFTVFTDHNPLTYVLTTAKLDATGHRWLAELSRYQFQIFYKPGRTNKAADGLSRRSNPDKEQEQCTQQISPEIFKEICRILTSDGFTSVAELLGVPPTVFSQAVTADVSSADWSAEQQKDVDVRRVHHLVSKGTRLTNRQRRQEASSVMKLLSHWDSLVIEEKVLYKKADTQEGKVLRLIVPKHMQSKVLSMSHDEMGHLGREKTLSIARTRYFWIGLTKSVEDRIRTCPRCVRAKTPYQPDRAPMGTIEATRPLEIVCMDFLSLENSKGGYNSILVMTDVCTKYAWAFPTRNQEAKTVAKILVDQFVVNFGIPERLHSDQGQCFQGKVIQHMCKLLGMSKSRTTAYHPQGNPVERFNRTLISMLKTLEPAEKLQWKSYVAPLVHAYNCTRNETTGYTPYFLMFGRPPRLSIDVFLGLPDTYQRSPQEVKDRLQSAYKAANQASKEATKRRAKYYNRKVKGVSLECGDLVLVKNVGLKGKHKLADRWKQEVYVVIEQPNKDIPVFKVRSEKREGPDRVLHRNFLLPLTLPMSDLKTGTPSEEPVVRRADGGDDSDSGSDDCVLSDDDDIDVIVSVVDDEVGSPVPHSPVSVVPNTPQYATSERSDRAISTPGSTSGEQLGSPVRSSVSSEGSLERSSVPAIVEPEVDGGLEEVEASEAEAEEVSEVPLRRSGRVRQKPDRYGNNVMLSAAQAQMQNNDWQFKALVLLHLLCIFPLQRAEIMNALLYLLTHS